MSVLSDTSMQKDIAMVGCTFETQMQNVKGKRETTTRILAIFLAGKEIYFTAMTVSATSEVISIHTVRVTKG